jgi:hypothetical protein
MTALFALTLLAVGVGYWGYVTYLRYDRVAAHHLPPDTTAALRVDIAEGLLYNPVRQHLVPILFELGRTESASDYARRFEEATGLKRRDLREVVVARGSNLTDWVLVVAGLFPRSGVVPKLEAFLTGEGGPWRRESPVGEAEVLVHGPTGFAIAQADDGALIVGSSRARVVQAIPSRTNAGDLGLDVTAPAAFTASREAFASYVHHPLARLAPGLSELARLGRLRGVVALGDPFELRLMLDPAPGVPASTLHTSAKRVLDALALLVRFVSPRDRAGERSLLERAELHPLNADYVLITASWRRDEVARGAHSLADALRAWLDLPPAPN